MKITEEALDRALKVLGGVVLIEMICILAYVAILYSKGEL